MKVRVLGSGGASGVPAISAGWGCCDPTNPRNRRRRPSILIEHQGTTVLIDTSPDLREQLLDAGVRHLDGVILTHDHADHLHGLDDLREVNRAMRAAIPVWATAATLETARRRFGYAFEPLEPGQTIYKPLLEAHEVEGPFRIGALDVLPFDQDHGYARTLGLRFGPLAYSTDVVELPEQAFAVLAGIEVWIVGCLVDHPHPTHAHVDKVLGWVERVRPRQTWLSHLGTKLDYETLKARLPAGVEPAYDNLVVELD